MKYKFVLFLVSVLFLFSSFTLEGKLHRTSYSILLPITTGNLFNLGPNTYRDNCIFMQVHRYNENQVLIESGVVRVTFPNANYVYNYRFKNLYTEKSYTKVDYFVSGSDIPMKLSTIYLQLVYDRCRIVDRVE
jgi:hypothetical protein